MTVTSDEPIRSPTITLPEEDLSSALLRPGYDDSVLVRRVAGDDVLGGVVLGCVLQYVRLAGRDVDEVSRLERDLVLEPIAPSNPEPARAHVDGALASRVVV